VIAVCFAALSAGAAVAVVTAPQVYEAEMRILVKRDRVDPLVSAAPDEVSRSDLSEPEVLSQVELLKAHDLLERVVVDAGLVAHATPADPARQAEDPGEAVAAAVSALRRDLAVAPVKRTWMIAVAYRSEDRQRAQRVLTALARLYLEKHIALRRPAGTHAFFSEQAQRARDEWQTAQARLDDFSRRRQVTSAAVEKEIVLRKLADFEALRQQAVALQSETRQRVAALGGELALAPERRTTQMRIGDHAGLIQDLQSRLLTLEFKRTELLEKYQKDYRGVTALDEQIAQARAALEQIREAPVKDETVADNPTHQWADTEIARARTEYAAVTARVRALGVAVETYQVRAQALERHEAEQQDLVRAVKWTEATYLLYAQKQEEARISDALDQTRIANVVIAQAPRVPFHPRRTRSLAWVPPLWLGALLLSLALALVVDALAPVIRARRGRDTARDAQGRGAATADRDPMPHPSVRST
jgi:uncharacterized protein involved in exopolysaccharide biosynthesis